MLPTVPRAGAPEAQKVVSNDLVTIAKSGKLPVAYKGAIKALSHCNRVDECQEWADKAEALASYARQAKDDQLKRLADRIQARAIRRCGVLLGQIKSAQGANLTTEGREGTLPISRKRAAKAAGLSEHQRKTALRVAAVPEETFEKAVEGENPPTVTQLAELGI